MQETLGHSTYQITADIYAHVAPELKQVAADAIDDALGGDPQGYLLYEEYWVAYG